MIDEREVEDEMEAPKTNLKPLLFINFVITPQSANNWCFNLWLSWVKLNLLQTPRATNKMQLLHWE